jgi:hypothetical protein
MKKIIENEENRRIENGGIEKMAKWRRGEMSKCGENNENGSVWRRYGVMWRKRKANGINNGVSAKSAA